MDTATFIKKVKKDLPEFSWYEDKGWDRVLGNYFVTEFRIQLNSRHGDHLIIWSPKILWKNIFRVISLMSMTEAERNGFVDKLIDKDHGDKYFEGIGIDLDISELSIKEYTILLDAIRKWVAECDKLRKSDTDEDQIMFIHPDCEESVLRAFFKDFKCIIEGDDWKVGIVSTKDWDFGKRDLIDAISNSTADVFYIGKAEDDDLEYAKDDFGSDYDEKIEKAYPGAGRISKIYITGWD